MWIDETHGLCCGGSFAYMGSRVWRAEFGTRGTQNLGPGVLDFTRGAGLGNCVSWVTRVNSRCLRTEFERGVFEMNKLAFSAICVAALALNACDSDVNNGVDGPVRVCNPVSRTAVSLVRSVPSLSTAARWIRSSEPLGALRRETLIPVASARAASAVRRTTASAGPGAPVACALRSAVLVRPTPAVPAKVNASTPLASSRTTWSVSAAVRTATSSLRTVRNLPRVQMQLHPTSPATCSSYALALPRYASRPERMMVRTPQAARTSSATTSTPASRATAASCRTIRTTSRTCCVPTSVIPRIPVARVARISPAAAPGRTTPAIS